MIVLGLILLAIGVALMLLVRDEPTVHRIGQVLAVVGAVFIIIAVVLMVVDETEAEAALAVLL